MAPMRAVIVFVTLGLVVSAAPSPWAQAPAGPSTFHLFFLGHDIGTEVDTLTKGSSGEQLDAAFHFVDRGTAIDLTGALDSAVDRSPRHLTVKGRNYRLFASDSEVTIANGRAHVRDLTQERDVELGGKPFFPIDNYAPIGVQEKLIQYWHAQGKPKEIAAAPAGPIRIALRKFQVFFEASGPQAQIQLEELSIEGPVWGTETAFYEPSTQRLVALTTWAGALPFEAVREGFVDRFSTLKSAAVADTIAEFVRLSSQNSPVQRGSFALIGATVVTGTSAAPIANATILVRDNRIAAVGPASAVTIPRGTPTVDVRGQTIIPGLWDMHAHASQVDWGPVYLAAGVTSIRDMGGEPDFLAAFRDATAAGAIGPRIFLAGLVDGPGPGAFGAVTASTPEEGVAVTRRYHDQHFDEMKIYSLVKPDVVKAIVDEAHRLGMTVTGHVPQGMTSQSVVEAGFDGIAHMQLRGQSGSDASKQQIAFFKAHHTVMDPTESWNELGGHPAATPISSFIPGVTRLPTPLARMFASMPGGNGDPQAAHARVIDGVKLLKDAIDAGLLVVAGTDKGVPGFSVQREIELYVEGGMTPLEAIQAATIMPARAMRVDKETGTIEVGKRADLAILGGNPLDKISNIETAQRVVVNGRLYDCAALWKAAGYAAQ